VVADDFALDFVVNELENWGYRIEDVMLHAFSGTISGTIIGTLVHIKTIWKKLKNFILRIFQ